MKILNIVEVRGKLDQLWGWAKAGKSNVNYAMDIKNVDSFTNDVVRIFEKDVVFIDKDSFDKELKEMLFPLTSGHYKYEDVEKIRLNILQRLGL